MSKVIPDQLFPQNRRVPRGTAAAPLLFWFSVVSGLVGITFLRVNDPTSYVPLWFGAVVGISLGQLCAVLRLRIWLIAVVGLAASWFLVPAAIIALEVMFGGQARGGVEDVLLAMAPAALCGYASLSERGGIVAFWYPAMLWMLVILDGAAPGSFSPHKSLPLVVGLAALFVMFLRARESRRVELWQSYSTVRLAAAEPKVVLRASPLRGAAQLAWTGFIGAGVFLLAATVAPAMWQKERDARKHDSMESMQSITTYLTTGYGLPCCPDRSVEDERIKEYLPIHGREETKPSRYTFEDELTTTCRTCTAQTAESEARADYGSRPGAGLRSIDEHWRPTNTGYGYDQGGNLVWNGDSTYSGSPGGYNANADIQPSDIGLGSSYAYPTYPTTPVPAYTAPAVPVPVSVPVAAPVAAATPEPASKPVAHHVKHAPATHSYTPPVVTVKPPPPPPVVKPRTQTVVAAKAPEPGMPWRYVLSFLAGAFAFPLVWRFARRQLALRHLARPFWRESVDQRISNHWQRVLVGLRDAGIRLRTNEQPQAFAKRVGIAGMAEAATILERVRHGVRVEADDLSAMDSAATAIYRTARGRAGVAGRALSAFRWPLV